MSSTNEQTFKQPKLQLQLCYRELVYSDPQGAFRGFSSFLLQLATHILNRLGRFDALIREEPVAKRWFVDVGFSITRVAIVRFDNE